MFVPSRVIMFALGASTQRARSPKDPPDQLMLRVSSRVSRRGGMDSVPPASSSSTSGMNISTVRSRAASRTSAGSAYCPISRQVR